MKKHIFIFTALIILFALTGRGQEEKKKLPFELGADLMSRFVWRGQCVNKAPNIQPYIAYVPKFGLEAGAWGSYSFTGDYAEVDLYLSYGIAGVSLTFTDYFVMDETLEKNHFFDYRKGTSTHVIEGTLAYEGPENVPIKVGLSTMFYGADKKLDCVVIDTIHNDTTEYYVNQFSTYFEVSYRLRNIGFFAGITPARGYYGDGFGVVNLGISAFKDIKITDNYSLPVQASLVTNPQKQNIYLVFGISF
jgi:hypothetical protein